MKKYNLILLAFVSFVLYSCLKSKEDTPAPPPPPPPPVQTVFDWSKIADSAQSSLSLFYYTPRQYYIVNNNFVVTNPDDPRPEVNGWVQYWPSAHTLDVLVDAYYRTNSAGLKTKMNDLLTGMKAKNGNTWLNHFYDDMEWMGLASLRAFQATGDNTFKDVMDMVWADIKNGWSTDLDGGIWWNKDRGSKNACSNGPAAILAARLYRQFNNAADLTWAKNIYNWEKTKLFTPAGGVYDNIDKNGNVKTDLVWIFTYNQGTFFGAAYELYRITGEAQYLNDAIKAADYTLSSLVSNGVLKDEGGGDGGLFKGVFVRYLAAAVVDGSLPADKKSTYINFLKKNAETLWVSGTNKTNVLFGTNWSAKPGTQTDLTTQLSGIMLIEAAASLKKNGLF